MRKLVEEKFVEDLRSMTTENQYSELRKYGHVKADVSGSGYSGEWRTTVYQYYGTKWFCHIVNGEVMQLQEV